MFFIKHADKVSLKYRVLFMAFHMKLNWGGTSLSLGHLQDNSLSMLEKKIKRMKKSMTYSCQNRRLLKAQRKNEKTRKGTERVHFSSSSFALALWHEGFFVWWFGVFVWFFWWWFFFFWWLNNLGCSSRWVHDKLQKHGCFLSQVQSLYCKFVHDCFGVDYRVVNALVLLHWLLLREKIT